MDRQSPIGWCDSSLEVILAMLFPGVVSRGCYRASDSLKAYCRSVFECPSQGMITKC